MLALAAATTAALTSPIRVWDGIFAPDTLGALVHAGDQRDHQFTTVFDRGSPSGSKDGRTIIEAALCSVLDELDDNSRYVEYWWRGVHKPMEVHRDVDEAECRTRRRAGGFGVQRCPCFGHVLYLDIGDGVLAPTCVWEEQDAHGDANAVADARAGAPRSMRNLHVVPAKAGRLLRFDGALLHAVPKPALQWLPAGEDSPLLDGTASAENIRRSVLLFNTWDTPPQLPPPDDPPSPKALKSFAALESPPSCLLASTWCDAAQGTKHESGSQVEIASPLLGDACRRSSEATTLDISTARNNLVTALTSSDAVHSLPVSGGGTISGADVSTEHTGSREAVEVSAEDELAMKQGYAEHLEADFWGGDEEEDDEDEEGEDDDEGMGAMPFLGSEGLSSDFMANLASLQAMGTGGAPPGVSARSQGNDEDEAAADEEEEEEEEEDSWEEEAGLSDDFMANMAELQALEAARARGEA